MKHLLAFHLWHLQNDKLFVNMLNKVRADKIGHELMMMMMIMMVVMMNYFCAMVDLPYFQKRPSSRSFTIVTS